MLALVQVDGASREMFDPTKRVAGATLAPKATYTLYLIGVAALPVAALQFTVKLPSLFAVTEDTPPNVGAVVFCIAVDGNVLMSSLAKYPIL